MSNLEYNEYLKIDEITNAQILESEKFGKAAHEEMLFIITHQTYELWFKQMLWEVESIINIFSQDFVSDQDLSIVNHRLVRVNEIWRILISQINVLETMSPLEFLEFRNYLYPASGFQSAQFRLVENKLGLKPESRKAHSGCPYHQFLSEKNAKSVLEAEKSTNLLSAIESWLERTPYLKTEGFDFWEEYQSSVYKMFANERELLNDADLSEEQKRKTLESIKQSEDGFKKFMSKESFDSSEWNLSFEALQAGLFIQLYRHELKLQTANRIIEQLISLDENMTQWRSRHAQMALRMLGKKIGTGGSSGEEYLRQAADHHKVFFDFFKLTTYFIDGSKLKKPF